MEIKRKAAETVTFAPKSIAIWGQAVVLKIF